MVHLELTAACNESQVEKLRCLSRKFSEAEATTEGVALLPKQLSNSCRRLQLARDGSGSKLWIDLISKLQICKLDLDS